VVADGHLVVIGGMPQSGAISGTDTVLSAEIREDGLGPWQSTTPLPEERFGLSAFVTQDGLFAVGGSSNTGAQSSVFHAQVSAGEVVGWAASADLPAPSFAHTTLAVGELTYVLGGYVLSNNPGPIRDTVFVGQHCSLQ
jgi:hypothetical protein